MEVIPRWARRLWNNWDIRTFILTSLFLQIILIFSGSLRKRNASRCVSLILWSAYLLADWVAVFALGILSNNQDDSFSDENLLAFWAPFLLLHLGGPDTITAFALEDNELWLRHLLGLIFQVGVAIYVFIRSMPKTNLKFTALLMFLAGISKYGERSWSLMCASMDSLRNSMVSRPDPGPNYAKFMEEYTSHSTAGLHTEIVVEKESHPDPGPNYAKFMEDLYTSHSAAGLQAEIVVEKEPESKPREDNISDAMILSESYRFFLTFKRLIVDLILSFHDRNESRSFFLKRHPLKAFKVIEIELSLIYEDLYTKAPVIHTNAGPFLRFMSFSLILSALLLFRFAKKHGYTNADIIITYILLGGAVVLEIFAVGLLVFSDWAFFNLKLCQEYVLSNMICKRILLSNMICKICKRILLSNMICKIISRRRWSNSMAQHNLVSFCLKDQPCIYKSIMDVIRVKDVWDRFWHTTSIPVSDELKEFIFYDLMSKSISAEDSRGYKRFSECRGEWALQKKGYGKELGWSVEVEFDESILLWHIATDLCYYSDRNQLSDLCKMSKAISDYMLYLLIIRPFMLTAGIGQIRYGDTCAEAKNFFQRGEAMPNEKQACEMLLRVETKVPPIQVKGDRSKSVLFDACILAKSLIELKPEKKWKIVSDVWVEMLCFAASHCRGYFHAKQLSFGGELLTMVWFLMAHLGIGEQYRIEAGHARAKLIVGK